METVVIIMAATAEVAVEDIIAILVLTAEVHIFFALFIIKDSNSAFFFFVTFLSPLSFYNITLKTVTLKTSATKLF